MVCNIDYGLPIAAFYTLIKKIDELIITVPKANLNMLNLMRIRVLLPSIQHSKTDFKI